MGGTSLISRIKYDDRSFIIAANLLIILFLLGFLPFDLSTSPMRRILLSLLVVCPSYAVVFLLVKQVKGLNSIAVWIITVLVAGAVSNYVHTLVGLSHWSLDNFMYWMYASSLTLSIPFVIRLLLPATIEVVQSQVDPKSKVFGEEIDHPLIQGLTIDNFIYAQASENYVKIHWLDDNYLTREMVRLPISALEDRILSNQVVRCHRSFIINCNKVKLLKGNKRGYKVLLSAQSEVEIPVSINRYDSVKDRIELHFHQ